jgi:hypothetical protein
MEDVMLWRVIQILNVAFGIVTASLLLTGVLPWAAPAQDEGHRKLRRVVLYIAAACALYWGGWLVRWIVTGHGF